MMDGLCFWNHTPTPGLTELKKVFESIHVELERSEVLITNWFDCRNLSSHYILENLPTIIQACFHSYYEPN